VRSGNGHANVRDSKMTECIINLFFSDTISTSKSSGFLHLNSTVECHY
jgi:hypothetical protein